MDQAGLNTALNSSVYLVGFWFSLDNIGRSYLLMENAPAVKIWIYYLLGQHFNDPVFFKSSKKAANEA